MGQLQDIVNVPRSGIRLALCCTFYRYGPQSSTVLLNWLDLLHCQQLKLILIAEDSDSTEKPILCGSPCMAGLLPLEHNGIIIWLAMWSAGVSLCYNNNPSAQLYNQLCLASNLENGSTYTLSIVRWSIANYNIPDCWTSCACAIMELPITIHVVSVTLQEWVV